MKLDHILSKIDPDRAHDIAEKLIEAGGDIETLTVDERIELSAWLNQKTKSWEGRRSEKGGILWQ